MLGGGEGCWECAHYAHLWTVCMGSHLVIPQQRLSELSTRLVLPIFKFLTISALTCCEFKIVDPLASTSPGDCLIYLLLGATHGGRCTICVLICHVYEENSGGCLSFSTFFFFRALWEGQPAIFLCWPFFCFLILFFPYPFCRMAFYI